MLVSTTLCIRPGHGLNTILGISYIEIYLKAFPLTTNLVFRTESTGKTREIAVRITLGPSELISQGMPPIDTSAFLHFRNYPLAQEAPESWGFKWPSISLGDVKYHRQSCVS